MYRQLLYISSQTHLGHPDSNDVHLFPGMATCRARQSSLAHEERESLQKSGHHEILQSEWVWLDRAGRGAPRRKPISRGWANEARETNTVSSLEKTFRSVMEFSIPLYREDLLRGDGKGGYTVKECLANRELTGRIDGTP